jgi:hypothetical protein
MNYGAMRVRFKQRFLIQMPSSWCQVALTVLSESGLINLQTLQTAAPASSKVLAVLTHERKYETGKQESTKQSMMICK